MDIKLCELESLFEEINEIINFIEVSQYQNRRYRIFLASNNSNINYSIPNDTIAHLLGINTNYLISTGRFNSTYSFELLKEMCENPYRINQLYNDGIISYDNLFSPHIFKKIEGFKENMRLNSTDTEIICKYKQDKAYIEDTKSEKYNYIIIKKYNNEKIGIIGLVNKENYYVPMSNQLYDSYEDAKENLEKYLKNQEITIMTGMRIFNTMSDYDKTVSLFSNEKQEKIETALKYVEDFGCTLDVTKEVKYLLQTNEKNRTNYFEDNDLINVIVESIKNGNLIDINLFRNTNLSKIIETFNDFLCENSISKNDSISETYTKLKTDLEVLKQELFKSKEENTLLIEKNDNLNLENESLKNENAILNDKVEKIYELAKPRTI